MFDNSNPYTLRTEIVGGITRYLVSFRDGEGVHRETEVSRPVYQEFLRFVCVERNLRRWDERHAEQSELTDEAIYIRALRIPRSIEETVFDSQRDERLRMAIQQLPEIQRRRFVLYHEFGLTLAQIAAMEGCSFRAVKHSTDIATKKIKKYFGE
ncbi:MAG: sigma-70 family RNA polymerase sigma factor [Coriobacteriia bacterium]|nr:sigma-70 family RNA polymerase sigma factor [Coriobacteriia bacterium]